MILAHVAGLPVEELLVIGGPSLAAFVNSIRLARTLARRRLHRRSAS